MANNEPFQHKANYYKALMFKCKNARYANEKKANRSSNLGEVFRYLQAKMELNKVLNINRSRAIFFGNAVTVNRIFPLWIKMIES